LQGLGQILRPDLAGSTALPDEAGKAGIATMTPQTGNEPLKHLFAQGSLH
jgi:hypothetical protein